MAEFYTWIPFYEEFADKILAYKEDHMGLAEVIKSAYEKAELEMPKMAEGEFTDVDPFTTLGTFNRGLGDEKRKKLAGAYKELLEIKADVPQDFAGIPQLNPQRATFYYNTFSSVEKYIADLWNLYEATMALAQEDIPEERLSFAHYYNQCQQNEGVKWNITMGCFWVRPGKFINLDGKNREFISSNLSIKPTWFKKKIGSITFSVGSLNSQNYY